MNLYGKNILQDISNEIKHYSLINKGKTPSYVIINQADSEQLLTAMLKAKLIPDNTKPKKFTLLGLRVIRTSDIPEGYFDVTGGWKQADICLMKNLWGCYGHYLLSQVQLPHEPINGLSMVKYLAAYFYGFAAPCKDLRNDVYFNREYSWT